MGTVIVVPADNDMPVRKWAAEEQPVLQVLQDLVGGYIEAIPGWEEHNGQPCVVYGNEEGKLRGLAPNERATRMWWAMLGRMVDDFLVGDIVIVVNLPDKEDC
jgi:hypothetical protein